MLFRLAASVGTWRADAKEALWARLFTPAAKFVICKRGIPFVAEAMEVLGGIGYCEESELPRLYREMPVNQYLGRFRQYYVPGCAARSQ